MRFEAIIQSTNYTDLLEITLPLNKGHFDTIAVYTKTGDEATKSLCLKHGVECRETDNFAKDGAKFNRGAVYNESLANLSYGQWVIILDSDVILPEDFRAKIEAENLDKEYFYGARRYNIETLNDLKKVQSDPVKLKEYILYRGYGYGYFQMFHCESLVFKWLMAKSNGRPYYEHTDGSEADWRFRNFWGDVIWEPDFGINGHSEQNVRDPGTGKLKCLDFHLIHLGITGVNSTDRLTPKFT